MIKTNQHNRQKKQQHQPLLYNAFARILSLAVAGTLSLILTLYPQAVMQDSQPPDHSLLTLLMWGIAAGFVHGVGFVPRHIIWRILFSPVVAWMLISNTLFLMITT